MYLLIFYFSLLNLLVLEFLLVFYSSLFSVEIPHLVIWFIQQTNHSLKCISCLITPTFGSHESLHLLFGFPLDFIIILVGMLCMPGYFCYWMPDIMNENFRGHLKFWMLLPSSIEELLSERQLQWEQISSVQLGVQKIRFWQSWFTCSRYLLGGSPSVVWLKACAVSQRPSVVGPILPLWPYGTSWSPICRTNPSGFPFCPESFFQVLN